MTDPIQFYKEQLGAFQGKVKHYSRQMATLSALRLFVFIVVVLGVYFSYATLVIAVSIAVVGLLLFIYLVSKYADAKREMLLNKALSRINKEEIEIASGGYLNRDDGTRYQDANHFYSLDIDLFGTGSFWQYLNRTQIKEGSSMLASLLKQNDAEDIKMRQEAIRELSAKPKWRQLYGATSSLVKVETPAKQIVKWLENYRPFLSRSFKWVPKVFGAVSLILMALSLLKIIENPLVLGVWLLMGLTITAVYVKRINLLSSSVDKLKDTFRQYASVLNLIENENFNSELLQQKQKQIQSENEKASHIFKSLSKALDALDNRNNVFIAILGNGFFLTDIKHSYEIEHWIGTYRNKVNDWFEVVSFFDAFNSLGNFAFNHPEFVFPEIVKDVEVISATGLGHPLLNKQKRINSDLKIKNEQFFIVTGANMAGKSTFLRTVALHIVMANVGLPVCAQSSRYNPVKLITSMRTSDSLADDSSYFFSELSRLKYIVNALEESSYFIILDEILKGTNSTDKAIGSRKFIEKLVAFKTTGIIATHDLSLCEIESNLEQVKNYYFDAEIINDELYFDYKLKQGICKNMNASFLLKKMQIV